VDPDTVPDGTIADVVAWVRGAPEDEPAADGWEVRAQRAFDAETAAGHPRSTLVDLLAEYVTPTV
jgi:hypothetical protein